VTAADLPAEVKALLDAPNFWTLATVNPDGSPQATVMWAGRRDGHILMNSAHGRVKPRNIAHDPRVCIALYDPGSPYSNVSIQGRVVETIDDERALADINGLAKKYLGVDEYPFLQPGEQRVTFLIEPQHCWYRPPR
jgi:PPOX class probable F420-dependent enzyme